MAITLNLNWRGINIPNAYIRVDRAQGGKRENRMTAQMPGEPIWHGQAGVYADASQAVPIYVIDIVIPLIQDELPFPALYAALKADPEFEGAIDC